MKVLGLGHQGTTPQGPPKGSLRRTPKQSPNLPKKRPPTIGTHAPWEGVVGQGMVWGLQTSTHECTARPVDPPMVQSPLKKRKKRSRSRAQELNFSTQFLEEYSIKGLFLSCELRAMVTQEVLRSVDGSMGCHSCIARVGFERAMVCFSNVILCYCLVSGVKVQLSSFILSVLTDVISDSSSLPFGMLITRIFGTHFLSLGDFSPIFIK
uniref:Uncharacterized protein n=1 Tax=Solanum tuberosum TaxID=4113 RepID=M1DR51_SOLTU